MGKCIVWDSLDCFSMFIQYKDYIQLTDLLRITDIEQVL